MSTAASSTQLPSALEVLSVTEVSLAGLASAGDAEHAVPIASTLSLEMQQDVRGSIPLQSKGIHLIHTGFSPKRQNGTSFFPYKGIIWVYRSLGVITPLVCAPLASFYSSGGSQAHADCL